jgi:hypothetical protein
MRLFGPLLSPALLSPAAQALALRPIGRLEHRLQARSPGNPEPGKG